MEADSYFEPQRERDCTIHALNNAMGRQVISRREVISSINKQVAQFASKNGLRMSDEQTERYRSKLSTDSTFFSAEAVWKAAEALGRIGPQVPIPGFGGSFARVSDLPSWVVRDGHIVILGVDTHGHMHAIAARGGKLYDSQMHSKGPRAFTDRELSKSMGEVFVAYLIQEPGTTPMHIKKTKPF